MILCIDQMKRGKRETKSAENPFYYKAFGGCATCSAVDHVTYQIVLLLLLELLLREELLLLLLYELSRVRVGWKDREKAESERNLNKGI